MHNGGFPLGLPYAATPVAATLNPKLTIIMKTLETVRRWRNAVKWMHRNYRVILTVLIIIFVAILAFGFEADAATVLAMAVPGTIIEGADGGKHVIDGPLTTDLTREASPSLLLNEIDQQIVKIRPMATPLDQISRYGGAKHAGSMLVDYYNVDTKPTKTRLATQDSEGDDVTPGTSSPKFTLETENDEIFDASDTILVQGIFGYAEDGITQVTNELVLYVVSRDSNNGLVVMPVNGKKVNGVPNCLPDIDEGCTLIRMGRAASELDVQSPQFEALPSKEQNFCQIFKMQVEQSPLQRMSNTEVPWSLNDQEEAAIYDMRLGMEKSYLFGVKNMLWDPDKKERIYLTGGIWRQAGKQFVYTQATWTNDKLVDLMREAFTGNNGSKRKILLGGSRLIGYLSNLEYDRVVLARESVSKWGIDFTQIVSKFGTLYLLLSEVFDEVGMAEDGIVIDPEYIQKYVHIPFSTESLDLKKSGQRNTDALVMTEASCLVLSYPKSHMRIIRR